MTDGLKTAREEVLLYLYGDKKVEIPDKTIYKNIRKRWDGIAKPLDSMGSFEHLTAKIGNLQRRLHPKLKKIDLLVFCADNGIVEEGVSQSGQEVTRICAGNIAEGTTTVGIMAKALKVKVRAIDIGINDEEPLPRLIPRKVMPGTRNFAKEPAMTTDEAIEAIAIGFDLVREASAKKRDMVCLGEMGIGNTTTSAAVAAALLQITGKEAAGRGAGLNDEGLIRKMNVIADAIERYDLYHRTPLEVLCCVGGLDIAGMTGAILGGCVYHIPIMLDGAISMVAALLAERMFPGANEYLIPSHLSREPLAEKCADLMYLHPMLDAKMALGEGTGAMMTLPLLHMGLEVYEKSVSFRNSGVGQYKRY